MAQWPDDPIPSGSSYNPAVPPSVPLAIWATATLAHVALTAVWMQRIRGKDATADETWFAWILASTGSLALIVHVIASVAGLTLTRAIGAMVCWHVALAVVAYIHPARGPVGTVLERDRNHSPAEWWLERGALTVLWAIAIAWTADASASLAVTGSDAAHYHVPVAINLALGSDLFGLPPTPHLYPMTASALAAWFILPLHDTLLVDLTMLLPFALLAGSVAWLFRLLTGASGLAWATWPLLVLFSTPLFRASSLMSADLLFAAAFAALTAQLVAMLCGRHRPADWLLAGLATGLLLGAKTTGLPTAGLLWAIAGLITLTRSRTWPDRTSLRRFVALTSAASAVALGAGGIWLLRNWIVWGSPVGSGGIRVFGMEIFEGAPIEPTTYLSVLGDEQRDPSYSIAGRIWHYAALWLGSWYLPALVAIAVFAGDLIRTGRGPAAPRETVPRVIAITVIVGSLVPVAWLLRGAPWTSLEWTEGYSLRYLLPWLATLPLLAIAAAFPLRSTWFLRTRPALAVGAAASTAALLVFLRSLPAGDLAPPRLSWPSALAGAIIAVVVVPALSRTHRLRAVVAGASLLAVGLGSAWSVRLAADDARARANPGTWDAVTSADARAMYDAAVASERPYGRECASRRIFLLTRFDEPLALQTPDLRNLIYYAARDIAVTARSAPLRFCDYVIASDPVLETDKGQALITALDGQSIRRIAASGSFVLLASR